jgi:hypothetical protein
MVWVDAEMVNAWREAAEHHFSSRLQFHAVRRSSASIPLHPGHEERPPADPAVMNSRYSQPFGISRAETEKGE